MLIIVCNVQSRNAKSTTKRAAKSYERPGLSEEEIEEIREAFNLFDTDGSGTANLLPCSFNKKLSMFFDLNFCCRDN